MKRLIIAVGLMCLVTAPAPPARANTTTPPPDRAPRPPPEVRDVAADPAAHLGPLTLTGVVGIVTPGKGFLLVDSKEYQAEGFACLTSDEPTKIPVRWTGAAPTVKDEVRVEGKLVKETNGFAFIAEKVAGK